MSVDLKTIEQIAFLARIGVIENQLLSYQKEINQILNLVDEMQEINLENVEPMFHPIETNQFLSEDKPSEETISDEVFKNAPKSDNHFFLVPTVIE